MVSHCANPKCAKPLHYLREGHIFIFDTATAHSESGGKRLRHLEHFWLCGTCSQAMTLAEQEGKIRLLPRVPVARYERETIADWAS